MLIRSRPSYPVVPRTRSSRRRYGLRGPKQSKKVPPRVVTVWTVFDRHGHRATLPRWHLARVCAHWFDFTYVRYCHDGDHVLHRTEMTRWANKRHPRVWVGRAGQYIKSGKRTFARASGAVSWSHLRQVVVCSTKPPKRKKRPTWATCTSTWPA